jgi:uncharacterized protein (DUF885 family)
VRATLVNGVKPAYERLIAWFEQDMPNAHPEGDGGDQGFGRLHGHHMQIAIAQELEGVPMFRT